MWKNSIIFRFFTTIFRFFIWKEIVINIRVIILTTFLITIVTARGKWTLIPKRLLPPPTRSRHLHTSLYIHVHALLKSSPSFRPRVICFVSCGLSNHFHLLRISSYPFFSRQRSCNTRQRKLQWKTKSILLYAYITCMRSI